MKCGVKQSKLENSVFFLVLNLRQTCTLTSANFMKVGMVDVVRRRIHVPSPTKLLIFGICAFIYARVVCYRPDKQFVKLWQGREICKCALSRDISSFRPYKRGLSIIKIGENHDFFLLICREQYTLKSN